MAIPARDPWPLSKYMADSWHERQKSAGSKSPVHEKKLFVFVFFSSPFPCKTKTVLHQQLLSPTWGILIFIWLYFFLCKMGITQEYIRGQRQHHVTNTYKHNKTQTENIKAKQKQQEQGANQTRADRPCPGILCARVYPAGVFECRGSRREI